MHFQKGEGFLHVLSLIDNIEVVMKVKTYYSEAVMSMLANPADMRTHSFDGNYGKAIMEMDYNAKTMDIHIKHNRCNAYDIVIPNCILVNNRMYTTPLILPNLPQNDPKASRYTSLAIALQCDPDFKRDFDNAVNHQVFLIQNELFQAKELQIEKATANLTDDSLIKFITEYPYHEVIYQHTDKHINAIKKETEQLLWHQRLGHPSDQYLYTAHKFINGIPKFKHFDPILDKCPVCIGLEQPKRPGTSTTKRATKPHQSFSINFGFVGQA